ncbi:unnamed protein product [Staurois parvus]|uniref:Uncharacterized protein n=1 Tax=Staurois parvus TaxID=386267 RepID=A0ABN9BID3_9NEOB|nr:unnamed protein product [Staurois parvus]
MSCQSTHKKFCFKPLTFGERVPEFDWARGSGGGSMRCPWYLFHRLF